jgi:hypothetical protein
MGFDFSIQLCLHLCPTTGKPFVYDREFKKVYTFPTVEVPEEYRRFVQLRGSFLHVYTDFYNEKDIYQVPVEGILDAFPSWEAVKESSWYEGCDGWDWSEEDHDTFRKALEWFAEQPYSFQASWSY